MKDPRRHAIRYCREEVISFAQNLEDVLFFRAFKGKRRGTYVDIGAGHPISENVTYWLKQMDWAGVNIEPNPIMFEFLRQYRPDDLNLNIGISDDSQELVFYQVLQNDLGAGWGLSSFNPDTEKICNELNLKLRKLNIEVKTLHEALDDLFLSDVDILKIDVEGLESAILATTDWRHFRPKLICVEAVEPAGARPTWPKWEKHLIGADYQFALFDGLNAYYAPAEQASILGQLSAGINCHDRWRRPNSEELRPALPSQPPSPRWFLRAMPAQTTAVTLTAPDDRKPAEIALQARVEDWHGVEEFGSQRFRWTASNRIEWTLKERPTKNPCTLVVTIPFLMEIVPDFADRCYVEIGTHTYPARLEGGAITIIAEFDHLVPETIALVTPALKRPSELGQTVDHRLLGLAIPTGAEVD